MSSNPCANCGGLIPLDASYCISCGSPGRTTHFVVATYRQRALARLLDTIPILAVYSLVAALVGTFILLVSLFLPGLKALALNLLPPGCTDPDALNEEYGCFSIIVYPILLIVCIIMFIIVIVLLILIVGIVIAIAALLSLLFFSAVVLALKGVWLRLFPFHQGTTFGKRRLGMRVIKKSGELAGGGRMFVREVVIPWNPLIWGIVPIVLLWPSQNSFTWGGFATGLPLLIFWLLDYTWPLWHDNRQTLHDKIAGTLVVTAADTSLESPPGPNGGDPNPTRRAD